MTVRALQHRRDQLPQRPQGGPRHRRQRDPAGLHRRPGSPAGHRGRVHRVVYDHPERSGLLRGHLTILYQKLGCFLLGIQRKTQATHSPRHTHLPTHLGHTRGRSPARCEAARDALEGSDEVQQFCIRNLEFCIRNLVYFTSSRSRIHCVLIYVV